MLEFARQCWLMSNEKVGNARNNGKYPLQYVWDLHTRTLESKLRLKKLTEDPMIVDDR